MKTGIIKKSFYRKPIISFHRKAIMSFEREGGMSFEREDDMSFERKGSESFHRKAIVKVAAVMAIGMAVTSCGSKKGVDQVAPENLSNLPDTAKVAYMMRTVNPDSVARYICDASLGRYPQARIDTFAIATAYAYQNYADTCLIAFSQELDYYSANLPLPEKMKIYSMGGQSNPQGLGYEMGLEYVNYIRENKMSVDDVKKEINAFKEACGEDSLTYIRFIKGFKTVLNADRGKDLPEQIYTVFINY